MGNLKILDHPLIQHKITMLRKSDTGNKEFRELVAEIACLICYEATRDLPTTQEIVQTPICTTTGRVIKRQIAIIPILRAGIGMADGMLTLMPTATIGHIGIYRNPDTLRPVEYYCKLPNDIARREIFLTDPMLATGGTASYAIHYLKRQGATHIKLLCLIAAPEGIERIQSDHPDIQIYTAACDERLNEHGYIVPGLGDAGDRIFGTK